MIYPPEQFKEQGYIKVENFISKQMTDYFYTYIKQQALNTALLQEMYGQELWDKFFPLYGSCGVFDDTQALGDYSRYGDPTFDALLGLKKNLVEQATGLQLTPTYTYHRLYTTDTELVRHKDRPSCEISTTIHLGGDQWSIFIDPTGSNNVIDEYKNIIKPNAPQGVKVDLDVGDMLVYSGCELEHWREEFQGNVCVQVFLHYNHVNGQFAEKNKFDKRPMLGIPPIR